MVPLTSLDFDRDALFVLVQTKVLLFTFDDFLYPDLSDRLRSLAPRHSQPSPT